MFNICDDGDEFGFITTLDFLRNFIFLSYLIKWSRDRSVGIAMRYGLEDRGSISGRGKNFSLLHCVQTDTGAHPASYLLGTRCCFPRAKMAGA
jgi:hypothetical protein